jgi:hypothetical protein
MWGRALQGETLKYAVKRRDHARRCLQSCPDEASDKARLRCLQAQGIGVVVVTHVEEVHNRSLLRLQVRITHGARPSSLLNLMSTSLTAASCHARSRA